MKNYLRFTPDYIFETSWEVCNKIGGIYTVLSTRAHSLQQQYPDRVFFIGPDVWNGGHNPWFIENKKLFAEWRNHALLHDKLPVRIGRWNVPGKPIVMLVKFEQLYAQQNEIFSRMWNDFGVDSMPAYGDYFECCMFACASAMAIESFYRFHKMESTHVIAHFNEWQTGMGALYLKKHTPKIATVFTAHATSMGRSIAGNHLPLYDHLSDYNGDEMAQRLNMVSKHSVEKICARQVDCLTTVSEITAKECTQFLQRTPEVITPNGFDKSFARQGARFTLTRKRKKARKILLHLSETLLGKEFEEDTLLIGTSGRYEFKNKGLDVFIEALNELRKQPLSKRAIAFIMVPAWTKEARKDVIKKLSNKRKPLSSPKKLSYPYSTHSLHEPHNDAITRKLLDLGFNTSHHENVDIIFIPSYLNGNDGVLNLSYYDLLMGLDITVFPSYYEPWGYTPLESIAFSIPTITTSLAGFGTWALSQNSHTKGIDSGVCVIDRNDANASEVVHQISQTLFYFSQQDDKSVKQIRNNARKLASKAEWKNFVSYYNIAYRKALHNSFVRLSYPCKLYK